MSTYVEYPMWLYAQDGTACLVHSIEEEQALPGVWKDSPAAWTQTVQEQQPVVVTITGQAVRVQVAKEEQPPQRPAPKPVARRR
jgi:hypothetical protein